MLSLLSPLYRNTIRYRWPLRDGDDPNTWGPRIASGLSAWKPPVRHEEADEFIEAVDLVSFDQHLARIERLDAMIDRTIKRLVQLKSMKQMYRRLEPKLINIPASKDVPVQDAPENGPTVMIWTVRWSRLVRQAAKVDLMKRMIHQPARKREAIEELAKVYDRQGG